MTRVFRILYAAAGPYDPVHGGVIAAPECEVLEEFAADEARLIRRLPELAREGFMITKVQTMPAGTVL